MVPYYNLVVPVPVRSVRYTMPVKMCPGIALINNHFVTRIQIIVSTTGRQGRTVYPVTAIKINKLLTGNTIISLYIGQVIIFRIVVTGWPPCRLYTNVDAGMKLRMRFIDKNTARCNGTE
jgi:hypothetical protein